MSASKRGFLFSKKITSLGLKTKSHFLIPSALASALFGLPRIRARSGDSVTMFLMENAVMRGPDLSALRRSSVGFDRMLGVIDDSFREDEESYPPHDIEKTDEDKYRISLAVAGYTRDAIAITAEHNILTIEAR